VAGEPDGFREFVLARSPALLRTAWMLTGDTQLAEDLLQVALAKTWPHWGRVRSGQPEAYVRKVMVRTYGAWWRRRWRGEQPTGQPPEASSAPGVDEDAFAGADQRFWLASALAQLPVRQRQVVVLRYFEDLSEREVAALLDCSVGTVKSQASKGLGKLRASLRTQSVEEER
jgi:RNA polymerase sigma-70 factor (sigma-E family)